MKKFAIAKEYKGLPKVMGLLNVYSCNFLHYNFHKTLLHAMEVCKV